MITPAEKSAPVVRPVAEHFARSVLYWDALYGEPRRVSAAIYLRRHQRALAYVDSLQLPPGSRVLEVGCGAGRLSRALAERDLTVSATDLVWGMLGTARRNVADGRGRPGVRLSRADAERLPFRSHAFQAVVALGVVAWLDDPAAALSEIARILQPGGHLVVSVGNRTRLDYLLDPRRSPDLRRLRWAARSWLAGRLPRGRQQRLPENLYTAEAFERLLARVGLQTLGRTPIGFGPFAFFGVRLAPGRVGMVVERRLQLLADRGAQGLRGRPAEWLVLAQRPAPSPRQLAPYIADESAPAG